MKHRGQTAVWFGILAFWSLEECGGGTGSGGHADVATLDADGPEVLEIAEVVAPEDIADAEEAAVTGPDVWVDSGLQDPGLMPWCDSFPDASEEGDVPTDGGADDTDPVGESDAAGDEARDSVHGAEGVGADPGTEGGCILEDLNWPSDAGGLDDGSQGADASDSGASDIGPSDPEVVDVLPVDAGVVDVEPSDPVMGDIGPLDPGWTDWGADDLGGQEEVPLDSGSDEAGTSHDVPSSDVAAHDPDSGPQGPCPSDMVLITAPDGHDFCMDIYEASRADATASDMGMVPVATSRPGVLPWHVSLMNLAVLAEFTAGCQAAGKRMCTPEEWFEACNGPDDTTYFFGDAWNPETCNCVDTFCDDYCAQNGISPCNTAENCGYQYYCFHVVPTGTFPNCTNAYGLYDVNGNVWEVVPVDTPRGYQVRGGAFNCGAPSLRLRCDFNATWDQLYAGFRCCKDPE